jgi:elongation factor Ts
MEISAQDVKKLRDMTGAGMMDCKKALVESNGDIDGAIDYLRKKGAKVAELRAGRDANEGVVMTKVSEDQTKGVVVHVSCETDFVSKNEDFVKFVQGITDVAMAQGCNTAEELLAQDLNGATVKERLAEKVGTIGENISLMNYATLSGEMIVSYNHSNRAGVLVGLSKKGGEAFYNVGRDVAMQAAAMKPVCVDESFVTEEMKEREMAIAREKAVAENKPEAMIEKIAEGALKKFFKEMTLVNQEFVKDPKKTIAQIVSEVDKDLKIVDFKRCELGSK